MRLHRLEPPGARTREQKLRRCIPASLLPEDTPHSFLRRDPARFWCEGLREGPWGKHVRMEARVGAVRDCGCGRRMKSY